MVNSDSWRIKQMSMRLVYFLKFLWKINYTNIHQVRLRDKDKYIYKKLQGYKVFSIR